MIDKSSFPAQARDMLGDLRTALKEAAIENWRLGNQVKRLRSQREDLKEVLEEISQGHDAGDMRQVALQALDDGNGPPDDPHATWPHESPMSFTDKDTLGRGGLG